MKRISGRRSALLVALLGSLLLAACERKTTEESAPATAKTPETAATAAPSGDSPLGDVDFQASCAEAVRADFDRAVALLHHMMYAQAREAFSDIIERDPGCAMAHWGVAMSLFQPLWPTRPSAEDLQRGAQAVQQADELQPPTGRERALLAATKAFYREPDSADWWTRINRWAERMALAYTAEPDDIEIAAFYALSQLALAPVSEDALSRNARAGAVLSAIHQRSPRHPGAIHYTIHANDVDSRAGQSLEVVRSYADIAPDVPHALHMPTHIFVRLGEWPEVIAWNRRSATAALKYPAGKQLSHHYLHAADYLVYAHLQRGEDQQAKTALDEALAMQGYQPSFISAFHLAVMPARYAVERRQWAEAAALEPAAVADIPWEQFAWAESLSWFGRGLGLANSGDAKGAAAAEKKMLALADRARADGEQAFARYIEIDRLILAGHIARARGKPTEAEKQLRAAAALEAKAEKHPVTPGAVLPAQEALGDLLLAEKQPALALAAYQAANRRWPGRFNTLLGCARAAVAAGDAVQAAACYGELVLVAGESPRPELAEARAYIRQGASGEG